jgi:hypothetical protein
MTTLPSRTRAESVRGAIRRDEMVGFREGAGDRPLVGTSAHPPCSPSPSLG